MVFGWAAAEKLFSLPHRCIVLSDTSISLAVSLAVKPIKKYRKALCVISIFDAAIGPGIAPIVVFCRLLMVMYIEYK